MPGKLGLNTKKIGQHRAGEKAKRGTRQDFTCTFVNPDSGLRAKMTTKPSK